MTFKLLPKPPVVNRQEPVTFRPYGENVVTGLEYEFADDVLAEAGDHSGASAGISSAERFIADAESFIATAKRIAPLVPWFLLDPGKAFFTVAALALDGQTHLLGIAPKRKRYYRLSNQDALERENFRRRPDQDRIEALLPRLHSNFRWEKGLPEIARSWGYFFTKGEIEYLSDITDEQELARELRVLTFASERSSIMGIMNSVTRAGAVLKNLSDLTNGRTLYISQKQMSYVRRRLVELPKEELYRLLSIRNERALIDALLEFRISISNIMPVNEAEHQVAGDALVGFLKGYQSPGHELTEHNELLVRNSVPYLVGYDDIVNIASKDASIRSVAIAKVLGFDIDSMQGKFYDANAYAQRFAKVARVMGVLERVSVLPFMLPAVLASVKRTVLFKASGTWLDSFAHLSEHADDQELSDIAEMRLMELSEERVVGDVARNRSEKVGYIDRLLSRYEILGPELEKARARLFTFPAFVLAVFDRMYANEPDLTSSLLRRIGVVNLASGQNAVREKFIGEMTAAYEATERNMALTLIEDNLIPNIRLSIKAAYGFTLSKNEENVIFVTLLSRSVNELLALSMMPPVARIFVLKWMGIDPLHLLAQRNNGRVDPNTLQ